jgi:hypothetical protein
MDAISQVAELKLFMLGSVVEAHLRMVGIALYHGHLVTARAHLEQSLELSAAQQSSTPSFAGGYHPTITSLAWIPRARWGVGLCGPGTAAEPGGASPGPACGTHP